MPKSELRLFVTSLAVGCGGYVLLVVILDRIGWHEQRPILSFILPFFLPLGAVMWSLIHSRRRKRVLGEHRFLICPKCEYPLSALPPLGVCPECGHQYNASEVQESWKDSYPP
jgi:hypothetical protein